MFSFHCKVCDKSIKIKSEKRHQKSQNHQALTKSINSRYYIKNPNFVDVEELLRKYVNDYNKKSGLYLIICKFENIFNDLTYDFKISRMYNSHPYYYLRNTLISKIDYFTIEAHNFSHISKMTLTFITNNNIVT